MHKTTRDGSESRAPQNVTNDIFERRAAFVSAERQRPAAWTSGSRTLADVEGAPSCRRFLTAVGETGTPPACLRLRATRLFRRKRRMRSNRSFGGGEALGVGLSTQTVARFARLPLGSNKTRTIRSENVPQSDRSRSRRRCVDGFRLLQ